MSDLLEILIKAKDKCLFKEEEVFIRALDEIKQFDRDLNLDWDDGAGEEWARLNHQEHGIVYMINSKIGIIFARKSYESKIPQVLFSMYEVFITENYDKDEWFIDLAKLKSEVKQISWHASEEAVNPNKFSLNDLYFATV